MTRQKPWVGQRVRILVPEFVERVGYPRTVNDYLDEAKALYDEPLAKVFGPLWVKAERGRAGSLRRRTLQEAAYQLARKNGFGGAQRTLHTERVEERTGCVYLVESTQRVVTGIRYAGYGGSSWNDYDDAEGPSLEHQRHHTLLVLQRIPSEIYPARKSRPFRELVLGRGRFHGEVIDSINVERLDTGHP